MRGLMTMAWGLRSFDNGHWREGFVTQVVRAVKPALLLGVLVISGCSAPSSTPVHAPPASIKPMTGATLDPARWTGVAWQPASPTPLPSAVTFATIVWRGGIVVAGATTSGTAGAWASTDAVNWSKLADDTFGPTIEITNFAQTAHGLVAFGVDYMRNPPCTGSNPCAAPALLAWTSTDGTHWQRQPDPPFANQWLATVYGDQRMAIVATFDGTQIHIWASSDGVNWQAASISAVEIGGLAKVGSEYVATGYVRNTALSSERPEFILTSTKASEAVAAWSSTDGLAWTPVAGYAGPDEIVAGRSGYWGVTSSGSNPDEGAWWHSADGTTWNRLPDHGPYGSVNGDGGTWNAIPYIGGDGNSIVAWGIAADGAFAIWASSGDASWSRLSMTGASPQRARSVVVVPGGVLAVTDAGVLFGKANE
jgi:hypothetical protein